MVTESDIDKLAALARLGLFEEERAAYAKEIEDILAYIAQVREASSAAAQQARQAAAPVNVMREDGAPHGARIFSERLLAAAPRTKDGYIQVKQILANKQAHDGS